MRKRIEARHPLDAVQIDHAQIDAVAIDPATGDDIGRPWISLAFDLHTRMITGFYLSMIPPTRLSAGLCLLHSICDKTHWLSARGIEHPWPAAGLPLAALTDSQSFFGPRVFSLACRAAGVENIVSTPRKTGYGGHIEALLGVRLGAVTLRTGAACVNKPEERAAKKPPRMTLRALECWVGSEITGAYHHKTHPVLRRSPLAAWREHYVDAAFRAPQDCVRFRMSFLPEEECDLTGDGLELNGRTFWSRALAEDLAAERKRLTVRYDPRDLSRVFVKRPSGRFVKARAAAAREDDALARLGWADDAPLIASEFPDVSIAAKVKARSFAELSPAAREAGPGNAGWRGAACAPAHGQAPPACPRKCLSSCPFHFAD